MVLFDEEEPEPLPPPPPPPPGPPEDWYAQGGGPGFKTPLTDDPGPGLPPPPPPPDDVEEEAGTTTVREPNDAPLALPPLGPQPGTPDSVPFRDENFFTNRVVGGSPERRSRGFGPGVPLMDGSEGFLDGTGRRRPREDDELTNSIVMGLRNRR